MKVKKVIPLLAMVLAASACEQSPAQSQPKATDSSAEISTSLSTQASVASTEDAAAKALAQAKTDAQTYLASCDPALYEGDEKTHIEALIAEITGLLETATTAEQITTKVQELQTYLATAKTKAQYEEERAAAALAQAKTDAQTYLASCDPALYEGDEKTHIEALIAEITGLLETATTAAQINGKVQELQTYLATAMTKAQHEAERAAAALAQAKSDAQTYLASCDPALYEGDELTAINALITEINGLLETATTPEQISGKVQELQTYLATAKTKAEYEADRAAAKALADRKAERIKEVEIARPNQYRSEELAAIQEEQEDFIDEINLAESIEEVNAVSRQTFDSVKAAAKTNAAYMLDEMFTYRDPSAWALVNDHAKNYTHVAGSNAISVPAGLQDIDGVGYLMSPVKYQGDFELSMRLQTDGETISTIGLLFGNYHDRATGDGIDGYLINYDVAEDHQFVQIWYLYNAYYSYGEDISVCQYIGGWVYQDNQPEGKLAERNIRVKYDGYNLHIMDEAEYLEFGEDSTIKITVPLALNNAYSIDPTAKSYSFGLLNWGGNGMTNLRGVYVDELTTASTTNSNLAARQVAANQIGQVNLDLYEDAEKQQLQTKIGEIQALYEEGTYAAIMAKVDEFKALVGTLKTHEQLENERHPDISVEMLDGIYSGDPTKYTPSNWDLVNDHGLGTWTHEQGSHTVVTNGDAGYIMDAAIHTNFTVVFKVTGTQETNPYAQTNIPESGLLFGGNVNGDYYTGYQIVLSQSYGFQLHEATTEYCIAHPILFRGGYNIATAEGVTFRVTVNNGYLKLFLVDPTTGAETQLTGDGADFAPTSEWYVGDISGHFGIVDWGGASTYEILEFKDL